MTEEVRGQEFVFLPFTQDLMLVRGIDYSKVLKQNSVSHSSTEDVNHIYLNTLLDRVLFPIRRYFPSPGFYPWALQAWTETESIFHLASLVCSSSDF